MFRWVVALLLLAVPGSARAEWLEASSPNFVVIADDSEADVRRFSDQLERYHAAMAWLTTTNLDRPSPSNRVTVFALRDEAAVRRVIGAKRSSLIAGFYLPRAGRPLAVVPAVTASRGGETPFAMIILLHEYAHHFLISDGAYNWPRWASEGAAEFYSSAAFKNNGDVQLGRPAYHRAAEFGQMQVVTVEELLDPDTYERRKRTSYDSFYGKSWLLYHYLIFSEARRGQLARYFQGLTAGKSSRDAALSAFGDFKKLERELSGYLAQSRISVLNVPASVLKVGASSVRKLSAGEIAALPLRIQSSVGVDEEEAAAVVAEARKVAKRLPDDAAVLTALAEAEHDAGNDAAAIAAADAAIARDAGQVNAYVQKGYALFRMAGAAADKKAAYARARQPMIALNGRENDHPLPLVYYYRSFAEQGLEPPEMAVRGLERALELAPFDDDLRMMVALQQLRDGRPKAAKSQLHALSIDPHGGDVAGAAKRLLAKLEAEPDWTGQTGLAALLAKPGGEASAE